MKKYINLGIFAHIDAGKTTLTENILLESSLTKDLGKVDKQTSHVDTMDLERSMGITIQSTSVRIELENAVINLIDTPGHTDFYSEVERVIPAIDGAVSMKLRKQELEKISATGAGPYVAWENSDLTREEYHRMKKELAEKKQQLKQSISARAIDFHVAEQCRCIVK